MSNYILLSGKEEGIWHIDLKNGEGSCGQGEPKHPADATLTMDSTNFADMFSGIYIFYFNSSRFGNISEIKIFALNSYLYKYISKLNTKTELYN